MGYPGNTVELPFDAPDLAQEVARTRLDPDHLAPALAAALGAPPPRVWSRTVNCSLLATKRRSGRAT